MAKRLYDDPNDPLYDPATAPRDAADAVMQDRVRVAAILDSEHGKRNPTMAREMALQRGMSADSAISLLAMVPGAENPAASSDNPYRAALDREATIDIGAPVSAISGDPRAARLASIKAAGVAYRGDKGYRQERE